MTIKLRSKKIGIHVQDDIFVGPDKDLAYAGKVILDVGQWQVFGAALISGAKHMRTRLEVICEGDKEVVAEDETH